MNRHFFIPAVIAAVGLLQPISGSATVITGQMSFAGSVQVDATTIDWTPIGGGSGNIAIDAFVGNTGYFAALAGQTGNMLDLLLASAPVGVPNLGIANFITVAADPGLSFTLDYIAPGPYGSGACAAAPAAGQVCSVAGSPFGLSNITASSSLVTLALFGTVTDGSADPVSNWRGTYTAQFDQPYQQLINQVFGQGGSVANTYSATIITSPVPEPSTVLLLGTALLGLAWSRRRKSL